MSEIILKIEALTKKFEGLTAVNALDIDVQAFYGRDDDEAPRSVVEPWKQHTGRNFQLHEIDGGHFFIRTSSARFLSHLAGALNHVASDGLIKMGGEV